MLWAVTTEVGVAVAVDVAVTVGVHVGVEVGVADNAALGDGEAVGVSGDQGTASLATVPMAASVIAVT